MPAKEKQKIDKKTMSIERNIVKEAKMMENKIDDEEMEGKIAEEKFVEEV